MIMSRIDFERRTEPKRIEMPQLIICIGNSGRQDDGLGWAFADWLEGWSGGEAPIIRRYQLQIEDAEMISHLDRVLFVDATHEHFVAGFDVNPVRSFIEHSFSTHALEPAAIIGLCKALYGVEPEAHVLAIVGSDFELRMGLTEVAKENLRRATEWFSTYVR